MFPIICLSWQEAAINQYIQKHNLSKNQIFIWFEMYGELVMPDEVSFLRYSYGLARGAYYSTDVTKRVRYFIFRSNFGFVNVFKFVAPNYQIATVGTSMTRQWFER
jgi:hypothetical protein